MIRKLSLALDLNAKLKVNEFFVSEDVFCQVVDASSKDGRRESMVLNGAYSDVGFRYVHKIVWRGMVFISLNNFPLKDQSTATRLS